MYLPLAALATLVVVGGYAAANAWTARLAGDVRHRAGAPGRAPLRGITATTLLVAAVLGVVSAGRLAAYHNPLALWQDVALRQPHNAIAHQNLGTQLFARGRTSDALKHYREAVRLDPESDQGQFNLALALLNTGQAEASIAHFREAVRLLPDSAEMRNNLGVALLTAGHHVDAIVAFRRALELDATMWRAHDNLASALKTSGRLPEAVENYDRALQMNPTAWDVYGRLADAHARAGQPAQAIEVLERARRNAYSVGDVPAADRLAVQLSAYRARLAEAQRTSRNPPAAAGTSTSP
jgi:tetratricopeptide (TPR) repeat protein